MDRQAAPPTPLHMAREQFPSSLSVTPCTPRHTPAALVTKSTIAPPSTTPAVATPERSGATMSHPRYPHPLTSPMTPAGGLYPGLLSGPHTPTTATRSRWDIPQLPQSSVLSRPSLAHFQPPPLGSGTFEGQHQRSYSLDSAFQAHGIAPQERADPQAFFTPRVPGYDANSLGGMGQDFGSGPPPYDESDLWAAEPGSARNLPKRSRGAKKVDGKQPTFLIKLYDEKQENHHMIRWNETGDLIVIERPVELTELILPKDFRQSRFASFTRQLNIYGWMRKLSLRDVDNSGFDHPDASTWVHKTLRRDSSKDEILAYKRRVPPRPSQAIKRIMNEARSVVSSDSDSLHHHDYSNKLLQDLDETRPIMNFAAHFHSHGHSKSVQYPSITHKENPFDEFVNRRLSFPPSSTRPSEVEIQRPGDNRVVLLPSHNEYHAVTSASWKPSPVVDSFAPMDPKSQLIMPDGELNNSPVTALGSLFLEDQKDEDFSLHGASQGTAYLLTDASTWARSGYGLLANSPPLSEPHTSSLPNSFTAFYQQAPVPQQLPGMPVVEPAPAPVARPAAALAQQQVVTPGVYQTGFSVTNTATIGWTSPASTPSPPVGAPKTPPIFATRVPPTSPTMTKPGRRVSASKAPYASPPRSTRDTPPTGVVRTVGDRGERHNSLSNITTTRPADDEGLPSASLSGQPELFGGELATHNDSL